MLFSLYKQGSLKIDFNLERQCIFFREKIRKQVLVGNICDVDIATKTIIYV